MDGNGVWRFLRAGREGWKCIVATSSVVPRRPPRLKDLGDEIESEEMLICYMTTDG